MTTISLGTSPSPCLKYFCSNLGRTKTGKKEMLFYQRVCSISPEQSPAEKQRGLHMKMGGRGAFKWEKMSLSKPRRWHGFNEKNEVCCQNDFGARVCLCREEVSLEPQDGAGSGLTMDQPSGREAPRCRRAQSTCIDTARAVVQAGSVRRAGAGSSLGPRAQLCFLGCVSKTVTHRNRVIGPVYGLAV